MQVATETIQDRMRSFEVELKRVHNSGNIVKTIQLKRYSKEDPTKGIEVFVDVRVPGAQIKQISDYISKTYNFEVHFYKKSHSLKVWYRDAK